MGSGRMLFGQRSGFGRKTYACGACGKTARAGLNEGAPRCPCSAGEMKRKPILAFKRPNGAHGEKPRWRKHLDMDETSPTCGRWSKIRPGAK